MLELIIGAKGNGKTRKMVERANNESKRTSGSIIYIDKSNKHMYELSNVIRLVNLHEYDIQSPDAFMGFIQGLISSNHNVTHIFLDNFMMMCNIEADALGSALKEIDKISENTMLHLSSVLPWKNPCCQQNMQPMLSVNCKIHTIR